jgi:hypothetical protein
MSETSNRTERYENQLLRLVRIVLLVAMTLAIIIALIFGIYGGIKYFTPAREPIPAKVPPTESVNVQKFLDEIDPDKKKETPKSEPIRKDEPKPKITTLKYLEEVTRLYRCSFEFGRVVGVTMDEVDSAAASRQIENLRTVVEDKASSPLRGDAYVKNMVDFTCAALSNQEIIELRKLNKIQNVFQSALNFHLRELDRIKNVEEKFKRDEAARMIREQQEADLKKSIEKAEGLVLLAIAGIAFLIFMCIAVYLIFSKIERNLRLASLLPESQ